MIRFPWRFLVTGLLAAWAVDFLFWQKTAGVSFLIWTVLLLAGAVFLLRSEGKKLSGQSLILMGAILISALIVFLREEPFTHRLSLLLALGLIWLLTGTLTNGYWMRLRLLDYILAGFRSAGSAFVRPFDLSKRKTEAEQTSADTPAPAGQPFQWRTVPRKALPFVRGLLLALPVLAVLGALLASADPIFSGFIEDWLSAFDLEKLIEYLWRFFYILALAYLFTGLYLYAVAPTHKQEKPDPDQPMIKGFLGWTETAVVLISTNLLFAAFLVVQVRYFFGGAANINETGYTYAEYARRGFDELMVVAVLSLLLYLGLSIITKLNRKGSRTGFTILSFLLITQVGVMLVSAFQRLLLYEAAYGFTRIRIASHIFMIWLGVLLAAVLVLEIIGKRGWFMLAVVTVLFGFVLTLAAVNVDGQVLRRNIARAPGLAVHQSAEWMDGEQVDIDYLKMLSTDLVPQLAAMYQSTEYPKPKEALGVLLACQNRYLEEHKTPWQELTWSRINARRILNGMQDTLAQYPLTKVDGYWSYTTSGGGVFTCLEQGYMFD